MANLKIISDSQCDIYIDGDFISNIGPNKLEKVSLEVGEYWIQIVCCNDVNKKHEEIVSLQCDKVIKADFKVSIKSSNSEADHKVYDLNQIESNTEKRADNLGLAQKIETINKICIKQNQKERIFDLRKKTYISEWYDQICSISNGYARVKNDGKYGIINSEGKETVPCIYEEMELIREDEDFVTIKKDGKYGTIDLCGNPLIPPTYKNNLLFYDGLANIERNGKNGYIDHTGRTIIPFIYDKCHFFHDGYAVVVYKGKAQIIDKKGNAVYTNASDYDEIGRPYGCGRLCIARKGNKRGVINIKGDVIAPTIYEEIDLGYHDDCPIMVCEKGKYGWIDKTGKSILSCIYDEIYSIGTAKDATFGRKGGKFGLINIDGEEISDFIYDSCEEYSDFESDPAWVERNGKFGYINSKGEEVIPCIFDEIDTFYKGFAAVKANRKWKLIDKSGNVVLPEVGKDTYAISEDMICLKKGRKFGIVDFDGNELMPFIFDEIYEW